MKSSVSNYSRNNQFCALRRWLCKWRHKGDIKNRSKNAVSEPIFFNTSLSNWWFWIIEVSFVFLLIFLFTELKNDAIYSFKLAVGRLFRRRLIIVKSRHIAMGSCFFAICFNRLQSWRGNGEKKFWGRGVKPLSEFTYDIWVVFLCLYLS